MRAAPSDTLARLQAKDEIRALLHLYCRGVDRRDFDLVRSCYHPDAYDDHGRYKGDIDGFVAFLQRELPRFSATMHIVAGVLVELDGDSASCESYTTAVHRVEASRNTPAHDYVVGLRYLDRVERRGGNWRIAHRICAFDWGRTGSADGFVSFGPEYTTGAPWPDDPLYTARRPSNLLRATDGQGSS